MCIVLVHRRSAALEGRSAKKPRATVMMCNTYNIKFFKIRLSLICGQLRAHKSMLSRRDSIVEFPTPRRTSDVTANTVTRSAND